MRNISYGMMLSLDGFVAGPPGGAALPPPNDELHRHFNEQLRGKSLLVYGRLMYEIMQYWETVDRTSGASEVELEFAALWRERPKLVCSTTLAEVGPNAELATDAVSTLAKLKLEDGGDIEVAGPDLAAGLSKAGLIDEYRLYYRPFVLGGGKPYFKDGDVPDLQLAGIEPMPDATVLLRYVARR